jgi:hypothetical protein
MVKNLYNKTLIMPTHSMHWMKKKFSSRTKISLLDLNIRFSLHILIKRAS